MRGCWIVKRVVFEYSYGREYYVGCCLGGKLLVFGFMIFFGFGVYVEGLFCGGEVRVFVVEIL